MEEEPNFLLGESTADRVLDSLSVFVGCMNSSKNKIETG